MSGGLRGKMAVTAGRSSAELEAEFQAALEGRRLTIDLGVHLMSSEELNGIMREARERGVRHFRLENVCGQRYIATGVAGPAEVEVFGLSGHHAFCFVDGIGINTFPTVFPNGVHCPGGAQVAVGNTSNPVELNIAGEVNDLFAAYATSGKFRVAEAGGVRNLLLFKAGIPPVLRQTASEAERHQNMTREQVAEELLNRYQERRARIRELGWDGFLGEITKELQKRVPPVGVFGLGERKGVGDYFMEYAQGGIGILLNIFDLERPVGFYCCSGMTAGMALIRGPVGDSQLGIGVEKVRELEQNDRELLSQEIKDFIRVFDGRLDDAYQERLLAFASRFRTDPDSILSEFTKIVPLPPPSPGREEHV